MSSRRDYKSSGVRRHDTRSVRNRGLVVITLVLIGLFAGGLSYLSKNGVKLIDLARQFQDPGEHKDKQAKKPPTQNTEPQAEAEAGKPKYDFYKSLQERKVVIRADEMVPRQTRSLAPIEPQTPAAGHTQTAPNEAPAGAAPKPASAAVVPKPSQTAAKPAAAPAPAAKAPPAPPASDLPPITLVGRPAAAKAATPAPAPAIVANAAAAIDSAADGARYIIQAGAYSDSSDADRVRAQITLLGIAARVEEGGGANGKVHRVRIGPIQDNAKVEALRRRLAEHNISTVAIKLD